MRANSTWISAAVALAACGWITFRLADPPDFSQATMPGPRHWAGDRAAQVHPDTAQPVDEISFDRRGVSQHFQTALDAERDDASVPARRTLADGVLGLMDDLHLVDGERPAATVPGLSLEEYRAVLLEDIGRQLDRAAIAKTGTCIAHMTINRDGTIYGTRIRACEGESGVHRDILAALRAIERVPMPPAEYYTEVRRISFRVGADSDRR